VEKLEKDARALILDRHLTEIGIPVYGRSTRIRNDMKATAATVAGWLSGSLPSDFPTGLRFCDTYGICPWEWVMGIKHTALTDNFDAKNIAKYIRGFEKNNQLELSDKQFNEVFDLFHQNVQEGRKFLQRMLSFLDDN
tara:strand:+ start:65 stop:478 length:414 start_codon:yes stop_codon:yes gene_type:complete